MHRQMIEKKAREIAAQYGGKLLEQHADKLSKQLGVSQEIIKLAREQLAIR